MLNKSLLIILFILTAINLFLFPEISKDLKISEIKGNQGQRWAICIGINSYADERIIDLKKAANDAKGIAEVLKNKGQFDYVFVMTDHADLQNNLFPSKANIDAKIKYLAEFVNVNDLIVFLFSGHGVSDKDGNGYLIAADSRLDKLYDSTVSLKNIIETFAKKGIKKSLFMIDACREQVSGTKEIIESSIKGEYYENAEAGAIFFSAKAGLYSYEDKDSDYGVFTRFAIEGLNDAGDTNNDKIVTFLEVEQYLQKKITEWAILNNKKQKPFTKIHGEKFGDLALTAAVQEVITKDMVVKGNKDFNFNINDLTDKEKNFYDKYIIDKWKIDLNSKNSKAELTKKKNGFLAGGLFLSIFGGSLIVSGIINIIIFETGTFIAGIVLSPLGVITTLLSVVPFWFYYYTNSIYKKTYSAKVSMNAGYNCRDSSFVLNAAVRF